MRFSDRTNGMVADLHRSGKLNGDHFVGWNASGVTFSTLHISAEEVIIREEMPGVIVEEIMASVARFQSQMKTRRKGGHLMGQIPTPLHAAWHREWERGPKLHGVVWRAFLSGKLLDRDYSKFLIRK